MKISIEITGATPLICNRFTDGAAISSSKGSRVASMAANRDAPADVCEEKLYKGSDGKPMIPQPNLLRCLVEGGAFFKAGKKQITTQKSSLLYGCLTMEGVEIKIESKGGWKVDTRPVRIPSTGGRILAHRPMFDDWKLRFTAELDTDTMNPALLREIVDAAGKKIGLGDFRPQTKGPYGTFVVTHWKEQA